MSGNVLVATGHQICYLMLKMISINCSTSSGYYCDDGGDKVDRQEDKKSWNFPTFSKNGVKEEIYHELSYQKILNKEPAGFKYRNTENLMFA